MYPLHKTGLKTDIQPVNSGQIDQPRPQQDTSFDITASSEHNVDQGRRQKIFSGGAFCFHRGAHFFMISETDIHQNNLYYYLN